MLGRKLVALIIATAAMAATAAPAGASTMTPPSPQANDISASLIGPEAQPPAPQAAAATRAETVKYTMFLPLQFDASKNEVSIETA